MNLKDSTIIITGGAGGIGKFLAENLFEFSKKVVVIDKNDSALHPQISSYKCDLTNPQEVEMLSGKIYTDGFLANILINNAGFIHSEPMINLLNPASPGHSISNWQKTIDTNLNTVFYTTVNIVKKMIEFKLRPCLIINISSISAQGNLGQSAYSAAKAGVESLTKVWSKELGMFKIRCVAIAPGFFDTESTKKSLSENKLKKWEQSISLNRLGNTNEILSAVKFIIENDYFNGRVLQLDGGLAL